jgi:hypothetical protein
MRVRFDLDLERHPVPENGSCCILAIMWACARLDLDALREHLPAETCKAVAAWAEHGTTILEGGDNDC